MQRFVLTISLLVAACGPGMQHHHGTTPSAKAGDDINCNEEPTDPRASNQNQAPCRRQTDVDADKRSAAEAINGSTSTMHSR
jgi:hypothetical protein